MWGGIAGAIFGGVAFHLLPPSDPVLMLLGAAAGAGAGCGLGYLAHVLWFKPDRLPSGVGIIAGKLDTPRLRFHNPVFQSLFDQENPENATVVGDFRFPDNCCRCVRPGPESSWPSNAWDPKSAQIPLCTECRERLWARARLIGTVAVAAGVLGGAAGLAGWLLLVGPTPGTAGKVLLVFPTLMGVGLGGLLAWPLAALLAGWSRGADGLPVTVARVRKKEIWFTNPEYQRLFDQHNEQRAT